MPYATPSLGLHELAFQAFGVRITLSTNDRDLLERLRGFVPPDAQPYDGADAQQRFELINRGKHFELSLNEEWTIDYQDVELALGLLDTHLTGFVAVHASERIFVHSGVVAHQDRLMLLPGSSFAGKSTLVAALLRAGATYYSDDFALLDESGRVHPYPKPLSLRGALLKQTTHTPQSFGSVLGEKPLPPSLIVLATYRRDAEWAPRRLSKGEAVLALLENTVPARERPQESMRALTKAVEGATVLQGERDEADAIAPLLLAELESGTDPPA